MTKWEQRLTANGVVEPVPDEASFDIPGDAVAAGVVLERRRIFESWLDCSTLTSGPSPRPSHYNGSRDYQSLTRRRSKASLRNFPFGLPVVDQFEGGEGWIAASLTRANVMQKQ